MSRKGLDERQLQIRNSIGNQTFLLLLYLLMFDVVLYGMGVKWASYPANVLMILALGAGIYVIRLIAAGAFVGPSPKTQKPLLKVSLTLIPAILAAAAILVIAKNAGMAGSGPSEDISAPVMFVGAGLALLVAAATFVIGKRRSKDEE